MTAFVAEARGEGFTVRADARAIAGLVRQAPQSSYFWLRNFLGQSFGKHRQQWLRSKGVKFGRGGIRVLRVNEKTSPGPLEVVYAVQPTDKRASGARDADRKLQALYGEVGTGNQVLPIHEFGKDLRTSRWMALPVKTRPSNPRDWRKRYPDRSLITRKGRRGNLLLYEVQRRRARGRPARGRRGRTTTRLRLRFVLTKFVRMDPTLRLYDSWQALEPSRAAAWRRAADRILRDIQRGDPRDVR